jgi:hypothetical protein
VNAEDPLWSESGHEARHSATGTDRDDRSRIAWQLPPQLACGVRVRQRAITVAAAERDHRRVSSALTHLDRHALGYLRQHVVVGIADPPDFRAEQAIEKKIARHRPLRTARKHQDHTKPETRTRRRRKTSVVRLRRTRGDQNIGTIAQSSRHRPLQLAHLVASATQTGEIVALDPQLPLAEAESYSETIHRLQPGREGAEPQTIWRHHHSPQSQVRQKFGPRRQPRVARTQAEGDTSTQATADAQLEVTATATDGRESG